VNLGTRLVIAAILLGSLGWLFRLVRQRRLRGKYVLPWLFAVPVLALLALWPHLLSRGADALGVAYPLAAFLLLGVAFALLLLVHSSWELSRLEERTRALAEELAIVRALLDDERRRMPAPDAEPDAEPDVEPGD
jgi:hypothetical protein